MRGYEIVGRFATLFSHELFQSRQGRNRQLRARKKNRRKRWLRQVCEGDVVESDEGNVARDLQTGVVNGSQGTDGGEDVRRDYGGWWFFQSQQIAHRGNAALDAVITLFNQFRFRSQSARLHAGDERLQSSLCRLQVERAGNESDPLVIQREKMLERFLDALAVIDDDVRGSRGVRAGVHEDHWNVAAGQFGKKGRIGFRSHDGGTVYFELKHATNALRHAFRLVVRVRDDDFEAFLNGLI